MWRGFFVLSCRRVFHHTKLRATRFIPLRGMADKGRGVPRSPSGHAGNRPPSVSSRYKTEQREHKHTYTVNEREQISYERYRKRDSKTDSLKSAKQTFYKATRTDTLGSVAYLCDIPKHRRKVKVNTRQSLQKRLTRNGTQAIISSIMFTVLSSSSPLSCSSFQ